MAGLEDKVKNKTKMGLEPQTRMVPMMRSPMMPMAVVGRSPQSQARAMERMKGITERERRQKEYRLGLRGSAGM